MSCLIKASRPASQLAPRHPSHPRHRARLRSHQDLFMEFLLQGRHSYAKEGKKNPTRAVYCIPREATHIKIKRKQQKQGEQSQKSHLTAPPVPGLLGSQGSCSSHLPGVCVLGCSVSIPFSQEQNKIMTISSTCHPSSSPSF